MFEALIKLADQLDELGYTALANKVDALVKQAYSFQFFHGTSSTFLHKILKEGLSSSPKEKVWDEQEHGRRPGDLGLESYPGAYVSNNFMTAYSAAGTATDKFGGNRLMVTGSIESRSPEARIDEDHVREPGAGVSIQERLVNDWYRHSRLLESVAFDYSDTELEKIARTWITDALDIKPTEEVLKRGMKVLRAWLNARVALEYEKDKAATSLIYYSGISRKLKDRFGENIPDIFTDVKKARQEYRQTMDEFLAKAKEMLSKKPKDTFMINLRLTKDIGYKGSNKIGAIIEIERTKDWTSIPKVYVRYAADKTALSNLLHHYKTSIGPDYELIYP